MHDLVITFLESVNERCCGSFNIFRSMFTHLPNRKDLTIVLVTKCPKRHTTNEIVKSQNVKYNETINVSFQIVEYMLDFQMNHGELERGFENEMTYAIVYCSTTRVIVKSIVYSETQNGFVFES